MNPMDKGYRELETQQEQKNPSKTMVELCVDQKTIQAAKGTSLLSACLCAGIYIPHLCWLETASPSSASASCRLCFVEIDGYKEPITSCTLSVNHGMVVRTDTPAVRDLQKTALKLLLSAHQVACKDCPAHRSCALQDIAKFLGLGLGCKPFDRIVKNVGVDSRHPVFDYHADRCVLCGICIAVCGQCNPESFLSFVGRGFDTVVGYFDPNSPIAEPCRSCRACIDACPTGAIVERKPVTSKAGLCE